jgi:putative flavoprotein involved in K+ transport
VHEWTVELGLYDQPTEAVTDPAEFREPHPMLSGGGGGHTISYAQLARDGVRLLGRLAGAEAGRLRFGPDLPGNIAYADHRAAQFRHAVDEYVARAGIVARRPTSTRPSGRNPWPTGHRKRSACGQNESPP